MVWNRQWIWCGYRQQNRQEYLHKYGRSRCVGIGVGLKDFREVIIFNNRQKLNKFVLRGWNVGSTQASAEAKYEEEGASAAGEATLDADVVVYQLTEKGYFTKN